MKTWQGSTIFEEMCLSLHFLSYLLFNSQPFMSNGILKIETYFLDEQIKILTVMAFR